MLGLECSTVFNRDVIWQMTLVLLHSNEQLRTEAWRPRGRSQKPAVQQKATADNDQRTISGKPWSCPH